MSRRPEARARVKKLKKSRSEVLTCACANMGGAEHAGITLLHSPFTATKEQCQSMKAITAVYSLLQIYRCSSFLKANFNNDSGHSMTETFKNFIEFFF